MGSWQISLPPLPYAPSLVDSEVSAASPREAEQSRIFSLRPLCLWAHHKLQHQEAAVGWPLHIGDLGWGHWPVLTEGGMAFQRTRTTHTQNTLQISPGGRGSSCIPLYCSSALPCRFPTTFIATEERLPTFPEGFLSATNLQQPPLHLSSLTSPWAKALSAHKGTDSASFHLSKIWKLTPNLSFQRLPPCYYWFPSPLPQQSLKLLTSFTLVIFIKILYLEKK